METTNKEEEATFRFKTVNSYLIPVSLPQSIGFEPDSSVYAIPTSTNKGTFTMLRNNHYEQTVQPEAHNYFLATEESEAPYLPVDAVSFMPQSLIDSYADLSTTFANGASYLDSNEARSTDFITEKVYEHLPADTLRRHEENHSNVPNTSNAIY